MIDWIDVVKKFEEACEAHPIIQKFGYGRQDNKQQVFDAFGKEFPVVWITTSSFRTKENTISYSVSVDVFSILKDDLMDADKVISDSNAILIDLRNEFYDELESLELNIEPYHWELDTGENMAGVRSEFVFETGINNCKF